MEMVRDFIDLSERVIRNGGVVAVHCKAGLGRTGTLIGAYLIYKYGFTATEAVGFMRLMRPGTCVGPQQHYMYENQMTWIKWGAIDRYKAENPAVLLSEVERPITPPTDDEKEDVQSIKDASLPPPPHSVARLATPRAVTPLLAHPTTVPGQPRKTPGAKTRHAVAAPETVDVLHDDVFVDQMETQAAQKRMARASRERERTASVSVSVAGSHHGSASRTPHSASTARALTGREVSATPSAAERDEEMLMDDSETLRASPKSSYKTKVADLLLVTEDIKPSQDQLDDLLPTPTNQVDALQEVTSANSIDGNGQPLSVTTGSATNAVHNQGKTPTRIAKARGQQQRPLTTVTSAVEFNDENTNHASAQQQGNPPPRARGRSASGTVGVISATGTNVGKASSKKSLLGLGSVYEEEGRGVNAGNISSSSSSSGERYNLRAARSKEALSTQFHAHASAANGRHGTATPPPPSLPSTASRHAGSFSNSTVIHPQPPRPNTPSRLPKRVAGRRKAAVASAARTANHLGVPSASSTNDSSATVVAPQQQRYTAPTATAPVSARIGRNTRRRRSVEEA